MKRKICESLFAVTLALTVAVTNIPVTAFATEINQSARQEQTTENTQNGNESSGEESGNRGQQSGGLQENQGVQNGGNAGNSQNSTGNTANSGQNTGISDGTAGLETKKDNSSEDSASQTEQIEKKDNTSAAEAGTSGQQNNDAKQQEGQTNEQAAVLSSNGNVWELHGKITASEFIKKINEELKKGNYWEYKYKLEGEDKFTTISGNSIALKSGKYEFQGYRVIDGWRTIGSATIRVYYDVNFNVSGTNDGGVFVNHNPVNSAKAYDGDLQFGVKEVDEYDVTVTANNQELTAVNGVYSLSNLSDDTDVNVVYAPKAGANVTVTADHASVQLNGSPVTSRRMELNQDFPVVIIPEDGYAVESVTVNGETVPVTFSEKYAVSFTWNSGNENNADINITARVEKETLALKNGATISYHKGIKVDRLKNNIFNSVVDKENTVPSNISMDDVTIQYNNGVAWKELDYQPGVLEFYAHAFGSKDTEKVRITYKGNSQYAPFSETVTVNLSDERIETQMVIQEGITIQYNAEDVMKQELLQYITVQDKDGNTLPVDKSELTLSYDRTVGQQEMTVSYAGDDDYKDSVATATITITKGDATVSVNSQKITYGESFEAPIFTASPEEAKAIGLIVGITASGEKYASIDLSEVTVNDIAGTDIPIYGKKSVQEVMRSLGMTSIKVGQLPELFEKIQGIIGSESDIAGVINGIEKVINILEKIVPGINDVTIHIGELPTEAGVYTAAGVTVNSNYNTAIGVGTLVIAQKKTNAKLSFNQNIENKHNRLTAAEAESFDFGGYIEVDGNAVGDTPGIRTNFVGKTATGEIVSGTEAFKEEGEYIETISIIGGNYLAIPIVRTYTIGEAKNTIQFEKKIVYASYDGNEHGMTAYAYNEDGDKLGEAALEYQNILQTSTNVSPAENSSAPIDAGMYRVVAAYDNAELEVGTLVITKAVAQGTVTVENAETTYGQKLNLNSVIIQTKNIAQRDIAAIQDTIACAGSDEAIGSHAITVTVPESVSRNYLRTIEVNKGTHTIISKEVTITADSCKAQYGNTFPEFTYQISGVSDKENLGDISVVKREDGNHVGTYTLDVQVANQNSNYKYNLESGTLTIKKRAITVTIDKKQKVKGQKDPTLTYTVEGDGLVEGDSLGIYLSRKSGEKVGLYDIYMDASNLNKDYELASEPSGKDKFEIVENKAGLTNQKNDSGKSKTNGTQVKSVKQQPGTVWDRIKTGDNNKPIGYFIAVLISLAAIIMIISARFQRKK